MQAELLRANPQTRIHIVGVNEAGEEDGNALIVDGRNIPWLQDSEAQDAWSRWAVDYRDVVILDGGNVPVAVFNLSQHNLQVPSEYDALLDLLRQTAGE